MSLCERARRHVLIPLLRAATCPPTFPTGLKNQNSFIFYPPATPRNLKRIDDEPYGLLRRSPGRSGGGGPPTRRDLASATKTPHLRSRSASRFRPFSTQPSYRHSLLLNICMPCLLPHYLVIYPRTFCGPRRPSTIRAARLLVSSSFPSQRGSDLILVRATQ